MLELSSLSKIDQALLSKYELGKRVPSEKHLLELAATLHVSLHSLKKEWLTDKILLLLEESDHPMDVLVVAESRVQYLSSQKALQL